MKREKLKLHALILGIILSMVICNTKALDVKSARAGALVGGATVGICVGAATYLALKKKLHDQKSKRRLAAAIIMASMTCACTWYFLSNHLYAYTPQGRTVKAEHLFNKVSEHKILKHNFTNLEALQAYCAQPSQNKDVTGKLLRHLHTSLDNSYNLLKKASIELKQEGRDHHFIERCERQKRKILMQQSSIESLIQRVKKIPGK